MISFVTIDYPRVIYPGLQVIVSIEISGNASHFVANYSSIFGQSTIMNSTIQNGSILIRTIFIPYDLYKFSIETITCKPGYITLGYTVA